HDAAIYAFSQARELGLGRPTRAAPLAAAGLALVPAVTGEPDLARSALQDEALQAYLSTHDGADPGDLVSVTTRITEAFIAVDRCEEDAADKVAQIVDPRNRA